MWLLVVVVGVVFKRLVGGSSCMKLSLSWKSLVVI